MTIVEAFACGTPVIASAHGSPNEVVADGRTGKLFRPSDPQDLAEKVTWAWEHPKAMELWGEQARSEYELKYTEQSNYRILMEVYERAIQNYGKRRRASVPASLVPINISGVSTAQSQEVRDPGH